MTEVAESRLRRILRAAFRTKHRDSSCRAEPCQSRESVVSDSPITVAIVSCSPAGQGRRDSGLPRCRCHGSSACPMINKSSTAWRRRRRFPRVMKSSELQPREIYEEERQGRPGRSDRGDSCRTDQDEQVVVQWRRAVGIRGAGLHLPVDRRADIEHRDLGPDRRAALAHQEHPALEQLGRGRQHGELPAGPVHCAFRGLTGRSLQPAPADNNRSDRHDARGVCPWCHGFISRRLEARDYHHCRGHRCCVRV